MDSVQKHLDSLGWLLTKLKRFPRVFLRFLKKTSMVWSLGFFVPLFVSLEKIHVSRKWFHARVNAVKIVLRPELAT